MRRLLNFGFAEVAECHQRSLVILSHQTSSGFQFSKFSCFVFGGVLVIEKNKAWPAAEEKWLEVNVFCLPVNCGEGCRIVVETATLTAGSLFVHYHLSPLGCICFTTRLTETKQHPAGPAQDCRLVYNVTATGWRCSCFSQLLPKLQLCISCSIG